MKKYYLEPDSGQVHDLKLIVEKNRPFLAVVPRVFLGHKKDREVFVGSREGLKRETEDLKSYRDLLSLGNITEIDTADEGLRPSKTRDREEFLAGVAIIKETTKAKIPDGVSIRFGIAFVE
jgi:hypothetical protein